MRDQKLDETVTTDEAQDRAKFVRQTTVDRVLSYALSAIDKPGAEGILNVSHSALAREVERDRGVVEEALERARDLAEQNPRDFVASGAVQLLSNALA
jgi:hypothetical protein